MTKKDPIDSIVRLAGVLTGNQLGPQHRTMIEARLQKRLYELNLKTLDDYLLYFNEHEQEEKIKLIGLLTTHHTYFFREFIHFEYLSTTALPRLVSIVRARPEKTLKVWSAGCSRGQEVYSLAMYLSFHWKRLAPDLRFEILGTDIDQDSVGIAKNGVYQWSDFKEVPLALVGDHWARGTGDISQYVKAKKSLRDFCKFEILNLLDIPKDFRSQFDIIFCRNVFIYFEPAKTKEIAQSLFQRLQPHGIFVTGISESLNGLNLPIVSEGPSIYGHEKKKEQKPDIQPSLVPAPSPTPALLRVLCVDDSSSIHMLLKQVLRKEFGFEIVATAENGIEAKQKLAEVSVDLMTLDIHMPQQNGIEYLQKNFKKGHPPVVMLSSVSREDSTLAGQALRLGAADYIEKPSLSNLLERGEEIRSKLKCAFQMDKFQAPSVLNLDQAFSRQIVLKDPDTKLRLWVLNLSERKKVSSVMKAFQGTQPPVVLLFDTSVDTLPAIAEALSAELGKSVGILNLENQAELQKDTIWIGSFKSSFDSMRTLFSKRRCSILVTHEVSEKSAEKCFTWMSSQVLIEENAAPSTSSSQKDRVPLTSFAAMSHEFLCNS